MTARRTLCDRLARQRRLRVGFFPQLNRIRCDIQPLTLAAKSSQWKCAQSHRRIIRFELRSPDRRTGRL